MARQKIAEAELLDLINDEMAKLTQCRNLRVTQLIADPDRVHGCNWDIHRLRRSGDDNDQVECSEAIAAFLQTLRATYDI